MSNLIDTIAIPRTADGEASARTVWEQLAERFGTPFYAYDACAIDERIRALRSVLPEAAGSRIFYSFKSNPNPSVAARMREGDCHADLTSPGEIEAAQAAGFDLAEALYGGPGKDVAEFGNAIAAGIRQFSVESENDFMALSAAATTSGTDVRALLRVNPMQAPKAKLAMSGVPSQFGFEEEELRSRGKEILSRGGPRVSVVGLHIYWGTQIGDAEALLDCFALTVSIADELSGIVGFPLEILNLGGGFPWPYSKAGSGPDLAPLEEGLRRIHEQAGAAGNARWWFESGRYLSASSGTLVARVVDLKKSKDDKLFLILDTGIHHLGGMTGLGRIPRFAIDLEVPGRSSADGEIVVDVVGQLCTPLDCIGKKIALPAVEPGDLVGIPNVGAYGPTASVLGFLSRPTPTEILHENGEVISATRLRSGHEFLPL